MIRDTFFIASKDVQYMLRARETLLWVFVMPIVFFFFIGTVTGGFAGGGPVADRLAVSVAEDAGFLADQLVHRLEERDYEIVYPETAEAFAQYSRRLTIPSAFTDSVLAGHQVPLLFQHDKEGFGSDYENVRVGRAVYTVLADLLVSTELGQPPTPESLARLNGMPRAMTLEVAPAGQRKRIPSGYEQTIPGVLVMFTLMIMATSGAILLVIERRQGLLRRLASTPISRLGVVLGKLGGKLALGLIQIGFGMLAGTVLFRMDWGPNLDWVILVMICYGVLMAALGVLLGSLARTEGQAAAIGVISANVLAALGGCWWPIEITPAWMQKLQLFLPTGWAMDALHKLISFGHGPETILPHALGMLVAAAILTVAATKVFRFE